MPNLPCVTIGPNKPVEMLDLMTTPLICTMLFSCVPGQVWMTQVGMVNATREARSLLPLVVSSL